MTNESTTGGSRRVAALWLVAGLLAWIAFAIALVRTNEIQWSLLAAGLFCEAMGFSAWRRGAK